LASLKFDPAIFGSAGGRVGYLQAEAEQYLHNFRNKKAQRWSEPLLPAQQ